MEPIVGAARCPDQDITATCCIHSPQLTKVRRALLASGASPVEVEAAMDQLRDKANERLAHFTKELSALVSQSCHNLATRALPQHLSGD